MARRARLDAELVRRKLARSREQAAALVEAGRVQVRGTVARKVATMVDQADPVVVTGDDPASDYVFDSIGTIITKEKTTEIQPRTDEDWARVRAGAVMMAEGVYLLKVPRRFAPVGDENNSTGPEPEELSPDQITAKLQKDPVLWNAKIEALRNVGLEVLEIVKKKDTNALWDACEDLDAACENCHLEFWYPGERAYLSKLDRHLDELYGKEHKRGFGRAKFGMEPPAGKK